MKIFVNLEQYSYRPSRDRNTVSGDMSKTEHVGEEVRDFLSPGEPSERDADFQNGI